MDLYKSIIIYYINVILNRYVIPRERLEHRKEGTNMDNINSKLILNIEIKNPELLSELHIISMELSLSLDEFILYSIEKMIYDIKFLRRL